MTQGRIFQGHETTWDSTVSCDVCVIGSGSGGAWLAHELVKQGKSVVMLEEGGHHTKAEFDLTEAKAYPSLYQELGNRATDDLAITILQGRSVGGGTTVNWCASFRTPERILQHWAEHHGLESLNAQTLGPHWDEIEKRLHVAEWPLEKMNPNNRVLWDGLGKLGLDRGLIKRNVNNCANLGYCGLGCPIDAKQSMLVTTIPDAVERGLTVYANASARRIETSGRKATRVHVELLHPERDRPTGTKLVVEAKTVAVCGGAINSPALLLRSGIDAQGRVGTRTWLHPVVPMLARFEQPIEAWSGAPQSAYSHHFNDRGPGKVGFFLEVPPVHPMLASVVATASGPLGRELLSSLPTLNACIAIAIDGLLPHETGGTVKLRSGAYGRHHFTYDLKPEHFEAFKTACIEMARIQFAAGAREVFSLHAEPIRLGSVDELGRLESAPWEPVRLRLATAHQMGGCTMGKDPARSVVDPSFKVHGYDNLFVVDGSVLPTALGVNPQITIMGLARHAAGFVGATV